MTKEERLNKLEQVAKEYITRERKILNAEYNYLSKILNARGYSKLEEHNDKKASELLIQSIKDFLEG